jgi:hypothetical protein
MRSTFSPPLLVGRRRRRIVFFFSVTGPGENFPDAEQVSHLTSVRVERGLFRCNRGKTIFPGAGAVDGRIGSVLIGGGSATWGTSPGAGTTVARRRATWTIDNSSGQFLVVQSGPVIIHRWRFRVALNY